MSLENQFLNAIGEALSMALRALTTNVSKDEVQLTAAVVQFRLSQINREIEREAAR
jgi:hypothetical protein